MRKLFVFLFLPCLLLAACGSSAPEDEEITGADWRTWRGYAYITLEHDGTQEILAAADSESIVLYPDQEDMVEYAVLQLPFTNIAPDDTLGTLRAEDLSGDGYSDLSAEIFTEGDGATTLVWLWLPEQGCFDAPMAE